MADTPDSGSGASNSIRVRPPSSAPNKSVSILSTDCFFDYLGNIAKRANLFAHFAGFPLT